jgi:glutamate/tyrosine decarboxylase-like PLP-dependent enzyme
VRKIPSDSRFQIDIPSLRDAVEMDRAANRMPFCVIANAGTTNTGAIDPLSTLADYCREQGLWLHVDGAYGAAAAFCDRGQAILKGLGLADSLSLDPHKWLFQPYEIGCALVRQERGLKKAFHILPEYLQDIEEKKGEVNFCDRGIQLTRGFRALKLWMSLKVFGHSAFRRALNRGFELADVAEAAVTEMPDWEVVTPPQLGIITFRFAPEGITGEMLNGLNRDLVEAMIADGFAMISSTLLRGQTVLRMCTINPRTTEEDITETVRRLNILGRRLL